jgi:hypothetical protein
MTAPSFLDPRLQVSIDSDDPALRIIPAKPNVEGVYFYTLANTYLEVDPFTNNISIRRYNNQLVEMLPRAEFEKTAFGWKYRLIPRNDGGAYIIGIPPSFTNPGIVTSRSLDPDGTLSGPITVFSGTNVIESVGCLCLANDDLVVFVPDSNTLKMIRVVSGTPGSPVDVDPGEEGGMTALDSIYSHAAVLDNDNFAVVWFRYTTSPNYQAYCAVFSPTLGTVVPPFAIDLSRTLSIASSVYAGSGGFSIYYNNSWNDGFSWQTERFARFYNNSGAPTTQRFNSDIQGTLLLIRQDYTQWYATGTNRVRKFGSNRNPDGYLGFPGNADQIISLHDGLLGVLTPSTTGGGGLDDFEMTTEWLFEVINPGDGAAPPARVMAIRVG